MNRILAMAAVTALCCALTACTGGNTVFAYAPATGGDPQHGKNLIEHYNCGSCHAIPGIPGARGLIGPPLILMARRTYIAGELPNSPDNLQKWLLDPKAVEPGTAMPKLGLSEQQARDVAAYLYTLRGWDWNGGNSN